MCEGRVCDLETIDVPSMLKLIRKVVILITMCPILDLSCEEKSGR